MKKLRMVLMCILVLLPIVCSGKTPPTVKITAKVVDTEGNPVAAGNVSIGGDLNTPEGGLTPSELKGVTGSDGMFTGEIATNLGQAGVLAWKEDGYYRTYGNTVSLYTDKKNFFDKEAFEKAHKTGKWEPWERTIIVVLKPKKNPVAMYVKRVEEKEAQFPVPGEWSGYDLIVGDWVSPHGKGQIADVEFIGGGVDKGDRNYDNFVKARFPGKGNGLFVYKVPEDEGKGELRMPYEAPAGAYLPEYTWRNYRHPKPEDPKFDKTYSDNDNGENYFICIRSEVDEKGNVIKAMYGKIHAPFRSTGSPQGKGWVDFTYYINPDHTRNIEFDPDKNLFVETDPRKKRRFAP